MNLNGDRCLTKFRNFLKVKIACCTSGHFFLPEYLWDLNPKYTTSKHIWKWPKFDLKTSSSFTLAFAVLWCDSWLWLQSVIHQALVHFSLCILCHLSLSPPLSRASNNMVPLGVDKCGCCDKKLGEGKMQSVSISSHCQSSSASSGGNRHLIYWCVALRAASADYSQCNLQTVLLFHFLPESWICWGGVDHVMVAGQTVLNG